MAADRVQPDAADDVQHNNQKRAIGREQREDENTVRQLMSTRPGRRYVYNFLFYCEIFGNPLVPGFPDVTAANIGKQDVGKKLIKDIQRAAPKQYVMMLEEAVTREDVDQVNLRAREAELEGRPLTVDDQYPPNLKPPPPPKQPEPPKK